MRLLIVLFSILALTLISCHAPSDDTPGITDIRATLTGTDAGLFKLCIRATDLTNHSIDIQTSPASWNIDMIDYAEEVHLVAFIDANSNNYVDEGEIRVGSLFSITERTANDISMNIVKTTANVAISGYASSYMHPKLISNPNRIGSSCSIIAPIETAILTIYGDSTAKYGNMLYLSAFEDSDNDGYRDAGEVLIANTEFSPYTATWDVTVTLSY
jgi:hypothetical protein